ncbi:hypothetical protein [Mycobacterium shigaense]|uniref:hypothetical protein n=1 Tax=Mycobacterium shigaense TaxID=722731 RepID=UPI001F08E524|nr:hypothetical protein [Mycobacterium shigaense]
MTIWDGLRAPVDVSVFQKLALGSRIDDEFEEVAAAGDERFCRVEVIDGAACDNVACVSVVADELAA